MNGDLLVVGHFADETVPKGAAKDLDEFLGGAISQLIMQGDITGKWLETTVIHPFGHTGQTGQTGQTAKIVAKRVAVLGLGKESEFNFERLRDAAGTVVRVAEAHKAASVGSQLLGLGHGKIDEHHVTHAFAEGAELAAYHYGGFALKREERTRVEAISLLAPSTPELEDGLACGTAYAMATNLARAAVNTPGNLLTPTDFAERAIDLAKRHNLEYEVLEKADMERLGMGGLLAVNQGSVQPPKMIVLKILRSPGLE